MEWIEAVGRFFVAVVKGLLPARRPSYAIKDKIKIRIIAEELVSTDLSIDFFLLVMVHNGKGRLLPHGFIKRSIVGGAVNHEMMPRFAFASYQDILLDFEFTQLIDRVYTEKEVEMYVGELHKGGNLRTDYEYERVKYSKFFFLSQDKMAMYFIVLGTTADNENLISNRHKHLIGIAVNEVKNIINKY